MIKYNKMQDIQIKKLDDINYQSHNQQEGIITVNIILEIKMSLDKTILENIKMNFNKNTTIRNMLKEIIPNFNDILEHNDKNIYLNPESDDFDLCDCIETEEGGVTVYKEGSILGKRTKLENLQTTNFKLLYSPRDVLINFKRKKNLCDNCVIV